MQFVFSRRTWKFFLCAALGFRELAGKLTCWTLYRAVPGYALSGVILLSCYFHSTFSSQDYTDSDELTNCCWGGGGGWSWQSGLRAKVGTAGIVKWWERSPPTAVAWVRFPDPASMWVEFVVGFRTCSEYFSPGPRVLSRPQKPAK